MKKNLAPICSFYCRPGTRAADLAKALVLEADAKRNNTREGVALGLVLLAMSLATLLGGCTPKAHLSNSYEVERAAPKSAPVAASLK